MNRAAALAFGVPLFATVALLIWRERHPEPPAPAPVVVPAPVPSPHRPEPAQPEVRSSDIVGRARVIDGDTLDVAGVRIRLNGIDAPESRQVCGSQGRTYRCGDRATDQLRDYLRDRPVTCRPSGTDQYRRTLATCFLGDVDLGEWLVQAGLAVAFRRYSLVYVAAEAIAQAARRGLWADAFDMPWDYRAKLRSQQGGSRE